MANMDNFVSITGNVTADPVVRECAGEKSPISFSVAYQPRKFNRDTNQWEDGKTSFFDCTYWAKDPAKFLQKVG